MNSHMCVLLVHGYQLAALHLSMAKVIIESVDFICRDGPDVTYT